MKKTVLIMAGGVGERLWPKSRKNMPKQFLSLTGDGESLIQSTVKRISKIVDEKDIFISTSSLYIELIKKQLPQIPLENIIIETDKKNTAPCVGLASVHIQKKYGNVLMIVLPSDHLIKYDTMFIDSICDACSIAEIENKLVTIGIMPQYPETGYGYIKVNDKRKRLAGYTSYKVEEFVEKPDFEKAKKYIEKGNYLWNSGMFVWTCSTILNCFNKYLPKMYDGLMEIQEAIGTDKYDDVLEKNFKGFESISIDNGIMEKHNEIYVVPGTFGWDDLGNWLSFSKVKVPDSFGNITEGEIITVNTRNSIVIGGKKLISVVGVNDLVIIDTDDATLICEKGSVQDIKKVLETLKICGKDEYI